MGGSGSYTVGLHYPDRFGGIMPIDAATGARVGGAQTPPAPAWMEPQIAIHSPPSSTPTPATWMCSSRTRARASRATRPNSPTASWTQGGFSTAESFPGMPHNFGDQYPYAHFVTELIAAPDPAQALRGQVLHQHAALQPRLLGHHRPADAAQRRCAWSPPAIEETHPGHDHEHRCAHAPPRREPRCRRARRQLVVDGTELSIPAPPRAWCRFRSRIGPWKPGPWKSAPR